MLLQGKRVLMVGYRGKNTHIASAKAEGALFDLLIDASEMKEEYRAAFSNVSVVSDIFDWKQITPVLEGNTYNGVFTRYEDFTIIASAIRHHLQLPGVQYNDALKFRNKYLMRQTFAEHAVPSADFQLITCFEDAQYFLQSHTYPLIVKQIAGIHSKYVARVENEAQLRTTIGQFLAALKNESGTLHGQLQHFPLTSNAPDHFTHLLLEECITGEELTVDAFVVDGRVFTTPICRYTMPEELGFDDHHLPIRAMPYDLQPQEKQIVEDTVAKALHALGANFCVTHGELFFKRDTQECRLIEVAARGGGFRAEMVKHVCGSDYDLGVVQAVVGISPNVQNTARTHVAVAEVFSPQNGTLAAIDTTCLEGQTDVFSVTWNRVVGDAVGRASDGRSFILKFLVEAQSYDAAVARAKDLLLRIRESIEIEN